MSGHEFSQNVRLMHAHGKTTVAQLNCSQGIGEHGGRPCTIELVAACGNFIGCGADYFDALCRIREALEAVHIIPWCYGASRNVFPSGMGRDMSAGIVAYKHVGEVPLQQMVNIFDEGQDIDPASVEEQRAYIEEFRKAWKRRASL